jgi:hypothetical protein
MPYGILQPVVIAVRQQLATVLVIIIRVKNHRWPLISTSLLNLLVSTSFQFAVCHYFDRSDFAQLTVFHFVIQWPSRWKVVINQIQHWLKGLDFDPGRYTYEPAQNISTYVWYRSYRLIIYYNVYCKVFS